MISAWFSAWIDNNGGISNESLNESSIVYGKSEYADSVYMVVCIYNFSIQLRGIFNMAFMQATHRLYISFKYPYYGILSQ